MSGDSITGYTKINLDQLDDAAVEHGFDAHQESRFATDALGSERTGVSFHRVKPGRRQAFGHRHEQAEEIYVVIGGGGRVKIDDDVLELRRLDAIRVAPAAARAFEGGPDGLELLAFGPRHERDGEILPGWWD